MYIYIYYIKLKSRLSVRLSVRRAGNSVVPAWIDVGLALNDSYVLWHVQVCFKKFLSAIVCLPEHLIGMVVSNFVVILVA